MESWEPSLINRFKGQSQGRWLLTEYSVCKHEALSLIPGTYIKMSGVLPCLQPQRWRGEYRRISAAGSLAVQKLNELPIQRETMPKKKKIIRKRRAGVMMLCT